MAEGEAKNGDAISPVISTKDGKSSRDGKPHQSESANGVEAQLGGGGGGVGLAVSRKQTRTRELVPITSGK